jgi:hypothetical protein
MVSCPTTEMTISSNAIKDCTACFFRMNAKLSKTGFPKFVF